MIRSALLATSLLMFTACNSQPPPPDPKLLTAAERTVRPNTSRPVTDGALVSGFYFVVDSGYGYPRLSVNENHTPGFATPPPLLPYVDPSPIVNLGNFTRIASDKGMNGSREVRLEMDDVGSVRWQVATRRSTDKKLAIVIGDSVVSAPLVMGEIRGGRASISLGKVPDAEVETFIQRLNAEKKDMAPVR